jgi:PAS domain S-box-containing protein
MGDGAHTDGPDPADLRFDISRDLICTVDASGHFTSLNAAWERVLGWSREELMSRPLLDFVHPDDIARTAASSGRIAEADLELIAFENRYRTKDGDYRWLRWNARTDGETWFAIAYDITESMLAERWLREAIDERRLLAYSQPIVDQRTSAIVQEELLVRLRANEYGRVLEPAEFLPDAERNGTIRAIDLWMASRGIELAGGGRNVEVNLSAHSIADDEVMAELTGELASAGIAARRLVFEVTESAALANLDAAGEAAARLGRLGCMIALDDFGTGFASLSHLRRLPIQILKIDQSFVGGMLDNAEDRAVVRGIAAIARELGMKTVAEGVEDPTTYAILRGFGIDRAQGYLIGRPAPV